MWVKQTKNESEEVKSRESHNQLNIYKPWRGKRKYLSHHSLFRRSEIKKLLSISLLLRHNASLHWSDWSLHTFFTPSHSWGISEAPSHDGTLYALWSYFKLMSVNENFYQVCCWGVVFVVVVIVIIISVSLGLFSFFSTLGALKKVLLPHIQVDV